MEISYDLLLKKAAAYCSKQEVCPYDITSKLEIWGADLQQSEKIVQYLERERYIDVERYCRSFVNDKFRFNKWGKLKITQALYAKHIPDGIIELGLEVLDVSLYEQTLYELLVKKGKEIKYGSDYEKQGKLINFALQRGFEYAVAERVLKLLKK
jgi:regulatory protein